MAETAFAPPHLPHHPLTLGERALNYAAWGSGVALFCTVGWLAMRPDDPEGAVSLLTRRPLGLMIVQTMGLAALTAMIATFLVGRRIPDAGAFAVALGLAAANLRGDTAAYALINLGRSDVAEYRRVCAGFAAEAWCWFLVILVAVMVCGAVMRWCFGASAEQDDETDRTLASGLSLADVPVVNRLTGAMASTGPLGRPLDGLAITGVTALAALVILQLISAGDATRAVRHGQVYFSIAVAFYGATFLVCELFPVRSAWWPLLATPVVCSAGYVWTMLRVGSGEYIKLASIPPTAFARATPIEYVSVGTAGVLTAFWLVRRSAAHARAAAAVGGDDATSERPRASRAPTVNPGQARRGR